TPATPSSDRDSRPRNRAGSENTVGAEHGSEHRGAPRRGREASARPSSWPDDLPLVLALVVPLALFMTREQLVAGTAGFPLDDSWIHLHFARNLAEGAGFAYNPGRPVAGSTAPLWTV